MKLKEVWMNRHGAVLTPSETFGEKIAPMALRNYKEALHTIERFKDLEPLGLLTDEERKEYVRALRTYHLLRDEYPTIHVQATGHQE